MGNVRTCKILPFRQEAAAAGAEQRARALEQGRAAESAAAAREREASGGRLAALEAQRELLRNRAVSAVLARLRGRSLGGAFCAWRAAPSLYNRGNNNWSSTRSQPLDWSCAAAETGGLGRGHAQGGGGWEG